MPYKPTGRPRGRPRKVRPETAEDGAKAATGAGSAVAETPTSYDGSGENGIPTNSVGIPSGREKRLLNLAPQWKPGESGNPNGAPKDYVPYATAYRTAVTLQADELETLRTGSFPPGWKRARCQTYCIAAAAVLRMREDTPPALLSEVADRSDGKVTQPIAQSIDVKGIIALPAPPPGVAWLDVIETHLAGTLPPATEGDD